ncbi:hypothetical protein KP509_13G006600 [Ceratopteris richardii]|uniref:non-specific serine/threonine protein kinase n=2 Tax=Ceratopteris richardii TaxID=49495 RepID=A0A8T2TCT9_CERRI|nr:hypothetical protein KP509_13G006600 [Ceratopteris richardii]
MSCFHCSYPDKKGRYFKHRFTWNFFSQAPSSSASESKKSSTPFQEAKQAVSEPFSESNPGCSPQILPHTSSQRPPELRVFSFSELRSATKNFSRSNLLGEGGFGCVYKGVIKNRSSSENDQVVAVKQLNLKGQQGHKEWLAEVRYLGMLEHRNLVKLVGYCAEDDQRGIQRLLVYEFLPNRSLEDHLFQRVQSFLSWKQRLSVMLDVACGLAYLHEEIESMQVIFRDFKASNILLDADFTAKLSDFGLARQGPELGATHVSTAVVGTMGYAAPEYIQTGHLTSKSDVWSFGVVLLEILAGRRALDRNRPKLEQNLVDWVKSNVQGSKKVHIIMDPKLEGDYSNEQAQRIFTLALQCLQKHARTRPLMSTVVETLRQIIELQDHTDAHFGEPGISSAQKTAETEAEYMMKRRLQYKDVMNLRNSEDAKKLWGLWSPKMVET